MPADWPAAERARLRSEFVVLIEEELNPAYRKLRDFIRDEYLPACRTTVGWSALPDGAAWYASEVRRHTTTRMTPDEIHAIGLAEVARIRGGMEEVMRKVGYQGTLAEFFRYVQEEPAFYFTNPADLLAGYLRIKKQVNAELPRLFSIRPKADYEIRPVEAYRAAASAGGSYESGSPDGTRPGIFYVNTNDLKAQPIFGMPSVLNSSEIEPPLSTTMTPPSPPMSLSVPWTTSCAALAAVTPESRTRAQISCATTARMKYSPLPVAETAQVALSA